MKAFKRFILAVCAGSLVGAILFAWFSPQIIAWYFSSPADLVLSCTPAVEWGIRTYRKVMFTGVLIGSIVGAILFFAFGNRQKLPQQPVSGPGHNGY